MKRNVIFVVLLLLSSYSSAYENVFIVDFLKKPQAYYGAEVKVLGYFGAGPEMFGLYLSEDYFKFNPNIYFMSVGIDKENLIRDQLINENCINTYVELTGVVIDILGQPYLKLTQNGRVRKNGEIIECKYIKK